MNQDLRQIGGFKDKKSQGKQRALLQNLLSQYLNKLGCLSRSNICMLNYIRVEHIASPMILFKRLGLARSALKVQTR